MRNLTALGVAVPLTLCLLGSGCGKKWKSAKKEARELKSCRGSGDCVPGNICVRDKTGKKGVCVHPCKGPKGCFEGFRCTGNFFRTISGSKIGKSKPYCQKAVLAVGEKCDGIGRGCKEGAACFQDTCVKICTKTGTCAAQQKCVPIFVRKNPYILPWMRKAAYKGCVTATIPHNGKCDADKVPFCQPGNECLGGRCARVCNKDDTCPAGKKCHPFVAEVRKPLYKTALETLFHACQPATREDGAECKKNAWPLCKRGLRCTHGKCAKLCETTKDCGTTAKCSKITQTYGILKNKKKTLYKACVPATIAEGGKCGKGIWEQCLQKHRCHKQRCVRQCRKHEDCAQEKACSGRGFFEKNLTKASLAKITGAKGDFYFCQTGHRRFVPRATYNKCKSNRQCLPEHTCFRGKCRPHCATAENCPKRLSVKVPCKEVRGRSGNKKWNVCLGLF
ncbi:MAG: hypothetical protein ABI333_21840 [bacterium]